MFKKLRVRRTGYYKKRKENRSNSETVLKTASISTHINKILLVEPTCLKLDNDYING